MLDLYCRNFNSWRIMLVEYLQIDNTRAKKIITSIFYGGFPASDLPILWKLKREVDLIVEHLLMKPENAEYLNHFQERNNPKYTRFAYIMANLENNALQSIKRKVEEASLRPLCLIYDGAIIETRDETQKEMLKTVLNEVSEALRIETRVS